MGQRETFVGIALAEKGKKDGGKYVKWYNAATGAKLPLTAAWCAIFVSWCARMAGLTGDQVPNFAGCTTGRRLFQRTGMWCPRDSRVPQRGDLILFDWDGDPTLSEHVGIVTRADRNYVYTVEGNAGVPGTVRTRRYPRGSGDILGYAVWKEQEDTAEKEEDMTREETKALIDEAAKALADKLRGPVYDKLEDVPAWGQEAVGKLIAAGDLRGDETGKLGLSDDLTRAIVLMDRRGLL